MKVTMRPARALPKIIIHRKVAPYCRVSTQQEIQHHSLAVSYGYEITRRDSLQFSAQIVRLAFGGNSPPDCCERIFRVFTRAGGTRLHFCLWQKLWFGSVQPSPAVLVRTALYSSSPFAERIKERIPKWVSGFLYIPAD